jgi:hypothetical protein
MWHVDASFAVHPNMHGHINDGMTIGRGFTNFSNYQAEVEHKEFD